MGFVVTLTGYRPTPRFDNLAWQTYRIQEAPAEDGPWTEIDTGSLSPVDADPTQPAVRNFTTASATAESGLWYRVRFYDAIMNYETSTPVHNLPYDAVMTAYEIRQESRVVFAEYGYAEPEAGEVDPLQPVIAEATAQFTAMTGIDPLEAGSENDARIPLIRMAIRMLVEYGCAGRQMNVVETVADFDLLSSFNAGGYSETRRNLGRNSRILHPWPALNDLLNQVMFFDSNGHPVQEGPAMSRPGVTPVPGSFVNQRGPVVGLFGRLPTNPYVIYPEEQ